MGPLGLGADALGAGGAAAATAEGGTALLWNPAGLPSEGWDVGWSLGSGGPADSLHQALLVTGPLDEGLHGGLVVSDQSFGQAASFREDSLGLGLSAGAGRWLSLGTVQRLMFADPGSLRGWTMDAGALASVPLGGAWRLRLAGSASDLFSSLAWGNGLEEAQPSVLRLGAALEAAPGLWLSVQQDHLDRQGNGGLDQWRLGAQAAFFGQRLALRAGATQASLGGLYYTAGLGGRLKLLGQRGQADYALMLPSGPGAAARHVVSLRWDFGVEPDQPEAALGHNLTDRQGRLRMASIALGHAPKDVQDWRLELKDKRGKVVRVLHGQGPLPPSVAWDGKDDLGQPVEAAGISYDLRATRASGSLVQHHALLAPAAETGLGADLAGAGADEGFGLREGGSAAAVVKPKVRLKGSGDLAVSEADFDLSGVSGGADAAAWEVRIVDASGQTVRTMRGTGRPPKSVRWEGKDDLGQPVDASLGASFEVRVTDTEGQQRVAAAAPVVSQSAFESLDKPGEAPAGEMGAPTAECGRDPQTHLFLCDFYFLKGSADFTESDELAVRQAAAVARERGFHGMVIDGFADSEGGFESNQQLSQERADAVLKALLEHGLRGLMSSVVARGLSDTQPVSDNRTEEGRARNRRVELRFSETAR